MSAWIGKILRAVGGLGLVLGVALSVWAQSPVDMDQDPLSIPQPGDYKLRVLSPTMLELVLINTKDPDPARVTMWDYVSSTGTLSLPAASQFVVRANGRTIAVQSVGFKRRAIYAPLVQYPMTIADRDLRVYNGLYLQLSSPVAADENVEVTNPSGTVFPPSMIFNEIVDSLRWSPAIHVNQVGYMPSHVKRAVVGYYLGSMGELDVPPSQFQLVDTTTLAVVHTGTMIPKPEIGFSTTPLPYQKVMIADFSSFNTPGEYVVVVPGLGASYKFLINEGVGAAAARAYALGLYHQRCGAALSLPFTRHTHGLCHGAPAEVPTSTHPTWTYIQQVAPTLNSSTIHHPYNRQGTVNVVGGHHDAGDYSKYTINSALLVESLVFAADALPGAGELDNLGIPESGDGKSDLLQEAKHEADFLAKMQDTDGGFYFLVYPRARKYENNVTPDNGDVQVVWPKQTAVTASAVGALAQAASSPLFKQQFPAEAALYMQKAQLGWQFLEQAIAQYGKAGSYQRITHYGDVFTHDDELAWAAASMFAATGDPKYHQKLLEWMPDPTASSVRRWGWWRLFEGYGAAIRAYAFAVRTGRLQASQVDADYMYRCEFEIRLGGEDQLQRANDSAYGTSFVNDSKRQMTAGWYFSLSHAFDMAVAYALNPNPAYVDALVSNMNYELGANPINMNYVTGIGWRRQRDIVSQFAYNDRQTLPPSGLPLGNIQNVLQYHNAYTDLRSMSYPADAQTAGSFALYDRWCDSWNVQTEAVVVEQGRGLGATAFLMARGALKNQSWSSAGATIGGLPAYGYLNQPVTAAMQVPGMDLSQAVTTWEVLNEEPSFGSTRTFVPTVAGSQWVEAESFWPDGRRAFAVASLNTGTSPSPLPLVTVTVADPNASESGPNPGSFTVTRTGSTIAPLLVRYGVGGTASNGSDYGGLSGQVTIPIGSATASVAVVPQTDSLTEGTETVVLTLTADSLYQIGSPSSGTVSIADASAPPPPTTPVITIAATDPSASEVGGDTGSFTVARSGDTSASLTVNLAVGGTASSGTDYDSIPSTVTIPAGAASAILSVVPYTDSISEGNETVSVAVMAGSGYTAGTPNSAVVTIADSNSGGNLPYVSIRSYDSSGSESGDTASVTIMRPTGSKGSLTVYYQLAGTAQNGVDYQSLPGSATIPDGSNSVVVTIVPRSDSVSEGNETVIVNLTGGSGYQLGNPASATVTIADVAGGPTLPTVSISASDPSASETGDRGVFTFTRSGSTSSSLVVPFGISGSATVGTDCNSLPGSVTIPAGSNNTTLMVTPVGDSNTEPTETVVLTLWSNPAYQINASSGVATVSILDVAPPSLPTVSVIASDSSASESGPANGSYTITRTGSTAASLTVQYSMTGSAVNGTDYNSLSGAAVIPAGSSAAVVTLTPRTDSLTEGNETAVLNISANAAYVVGAGTATITIADNPPPPALSTVSVTASDSSASEAGGNGTFTITRSGGSTASSLVVVYSMGGTASNGVDYNALGGSVTIPAGATSAIVTVVPRSDSATEGTETAVLTLVASSAYQLNGSTSATVWIADSTSPQPTLSTVNVSSSDPSGKYLPPDTASVTFTRSGAAAASPLTVRYTTGGSLINGVNYTGLSGSATIPAGQSSVTVIITPLIQPASKMSTIEIYLSSDPNYRVGGSSSVTVSMPL